MYNKAVNLGLAAWLVSGLTHATAFDCPTLLLQNARLPSNARLSKLCSRPRFAGVDNAYTYQQLHQSDLLN